MPFYLRKSVRAGPFRFNFSNSGVGVSVGVKGLRIGTGPRGHYVHAGRGGLYYRASLGGARKVPSPRRASPAPAPRDESYAEQGRVPMIEVQSGDVAAMHDAKVADLVDDLNKRQAQIRFGTVGAGCFVLIGGLALLQSNSNGQAAPAVFGIVALLAALPAWAVGAWLDSYKRTSVLFYNLEGIAEALYRKVTESFDALSACRGKWHIASGGAVQDLMTWKRNAGASYLVNRKTARLAYHLPKVLRCNVTPPAITVGSRTFFFLPELMLVKQGRHFGAVTYDHLQINSQASRFIEDGAPVSDAKIVDRTWKHPNKSGGPDRRFRDNRQLPVCLYDVMHLSSGSGVNELLEFSRTGFVEPFSAALQELPRRQAADSVGDLIRLGDATPEKADVNVPGASTHRSRGWKVVGGATGFVIVGVVVATYALQGAFHASTEAHSPATEVPSLLATNAVRSPAREAQELNNSPIQTTMPKVTVKAPANVRSGASTSAAVVRIAGSGETFSVYGRANGWVQVGTDRPLGWIAASLVTE